MIVFVLCVFGYFLGFLSNLFKALGSKPFIVPPSDIASAYRGLTDWEHLRYALAAVGVVLLVVLFFVVKSKIENRNHDDRNFDVSEKGIMRRSLFQPSSRTRLRANVPILFGTTAKRIC